jgi:AraC-like DNA-binding protein
MIPPPADSAGLVNTFYIIETQDERIEESVPAYSAQLMLMVRGRVSFTFADGNTAQTSTVTINGPQMRSADCVLEGPVLQVGASLTHATWQRLANLPADAVHDQLIPAENVLTQAQIAMLEDAVAECREGRIAPEALCEHLTQVLAAAPHTIKPEHAAAVETILAWLSSGFDPVISDLYASADVSPRQLQRICRRFFGVAPAQVLKRFRALRAAMLLAQPGLSDEVRDQLMATFFDQAHLIRDIRRYTGRTPTQFREQSLATEVLDPAAHGDAGALLRKTDDA